jgi:hypothetical protein
MGLARTQSATLARAEPRIMQAVSEKGSANRCTNVQKHFHNSAQKSLWARDFHTPTPESNGLLT